MPVTAAFGGTVGKEDAIGVIEAETAWRLLTNISGVEISVAAERDGGVHVGGNVNGVTVWICREGPSGLFQAPEYSQKTNAKTEIARIARKASTIFWNEFMTRLVSGSI
jgi:hypothetical protein